MRSSALATDHQHPTPVASRLDPVSLGGGEVISLDLEQVGRPEDELGCARGLIHALLLEIVLVAGICLILL
jgi:hypothetical protein